MTPLQMTLYAAALAGEGALLISLLGGSGRHYATVVLYCGFLLLSTISDVTAVLLSGGEGYRFFYYIWGSEFVRQTCQLAFVVTLVWQALPEGRTRSAIMRAIVIGSFLLVTGSLLYNREQTFGATLGTVIRNVSFTSAMINLLFWFSLVSKRDRDTRLLLISSGLGIQMTGDAIGQSLRQLNVRFPIPEIVSVTAFFLCLYIWWQAFRNPDNAILASSDTPRRAGGIDLK